MKPELLEKLDQSIAAATSLNMSVSAVAESSKIDECRTWMRTQAEYKDMELKPYLVYKSVQVNPSSAPIGGSGYAIKMLTK